MLLRKLMTCHQVLQIVAGMSEPHLWMMMTLPIELTQIAKFHATACSATKSLHWTTCSLSLLCFDMEMT